MPDYMPFTDAGSNNARQRIAMAMLQNGVDPSPVQSLSQGAARVVNALVGGMRNQEQDSQDGVGLDNVIKVQDSKIQGGQIQGGEAPPVAAPRAMADIFKYGLLNPAVRGLLDQRTYLSLFLNGGRELSEPNEETTRSPAHPPFGGTPVNRLFNLDGGRGIFKGPTHGHWCGSEYSGGQYAPPGKPDGLLPPIDSMDHRCMAHDLCYEESGDNWLAKKICDNNLRDDLNALPDSPQDWSTPPPPGTELGTNAYGSAAKFWFGL